MLKTETRPRFGLWLTNQLRSRDISISKFATRIGRSYKTVSDWLEGIITQRMTVDELVIIAQTLNCPITEIMTYYLLDSPLENQAYAMMSVKRPWLTAAERQQLFVSTSNKPNNGGENE